MVSILLDTCVWGGVVEPLNDLGHDVTWSGLWETDPGDTAILATAHSESRILVTLDKDFGELAVLKGCPHSGILRLSGFQTTHMVIAIHHVCTNYQQELAAGAIITADPKRIRIRAKGS
jgi:predicted nuclease of predicted toxin-antitoxin system